MKECQIKMSILQLFKNKYFMLRQILKFRTKNAWFSYFEEQIQKDIVIFAIRALKVETLMLRNFDLRLKLPSLHIQLNNYLQIWTQHSGICQNAKFQAKVQNAKFSARNTLFGYVWDRTWTNYCRIWDLLS